MQLNTSLKGVLRTTQKHLDALYEMNICTVEDLLLYLPRTYEDLSQMQTLTDTPLNEKVTFRGRVEKLKRIYTRRRKVIVTAQFIDSQGATAEVIWFNQPHIMRMLSDGDEVVLTGKVIENGYTLQIQSPQFERADQQELVHSGKLIPVYPQHDIITTKWLREKMVLIKDVIEELPETLPKAVLQDEGLLSRADAIYALHFPEDSSDVERARERMAFESLFEVQRTALQQKKEWRDEQQERLKIVMDPVLIKQFFTSLHFTPTGSQKIAIYEILKDMEDGRPMSRLLEGDVGSGKTLVATAVIAHIIRTGGQCALMVPTEVLARQHAETMSKTLISFWKKMTSGSGVGGRGSVESEYRTRVPIVSLLTGSVPNAESTRIKTGLANGTIDLVIGTHALLTEDVRFAHLSFVVIDEQHRFGVKQRAILKEKGNPHVLSMTATPIPRTLALTAYGHHDLSVLTEKPGNRLPIDTKVVSPSNRKTVENFIDQQIEEGRQVFVICPLIEESKKDEMSEIKNVEAEVVRLSQGFPHRRIALLHGRMKPEEKEAIMTSFKNREYDLLVSTSVIEVGIDVPNASIMIIEGSERFGLAQLHQFRGRVGRGDHKSYCFLFTTKVSQARSMRLKAMETHHDGFKLAEIDLKIRGPGELYGVRQSGIPETVLVSLLNPELVVRARRAVEREIGG